MKKLLFALVICLLPCQAFSLSDAEKLNNNIDFLEILIKESAAGFNAATNDREREAMAGINRGAREAYQICLQAQRSEANFVRYFDKCNALSDRLSYIVLGR